LLEEKIQSAPPEVQQAIKALREKVHSNPIKLYLDLTKVLGKKKGFEVFKKIHAINRQWRLSYPKGTTLYEAIKQAIPAFETIGMKMAVEKISDNTAREIRLKNLNSGGLHVELYAKLMWSIQINTKIYMV
jgi:hypothetical protein